jgi:hypothetical protein
MDNLQERANYELTVTYVRLFWVGGVLCDYSQTKVCQGNFTATPRFVRMESVNTPQGNDKLAQDIDNTPRDTDNTPQNTDKLTQDTDKDPEIATINRVSGRVHLWNPQNFKFRFERAPHDSQDYIPLTRFKDLEKAGVVVGVGNFQLRKGDRVRLIVKSKPPLMETLTSDPIIVSG